MDGEHEVENLFQLGMNLGSMQTPLSGAVCFVCFLVGEVFKFKSFA